MSFPVPKFVLWPDSYVHTHGMFGNDHAEYDENNTKILSAQFKKEGYQTGLFGKAHLVRSWVDNA